MVDAVKEELVEQPVVETPAPDEDYDTLFAEQVARNEAKKNNGESPADEPAPKEPAAASDEPAETAPASAEPAKVEAAVDPEWIAALPESHREAARAVEARAAAAEALAAKKDHDLRSTAGRMSAYQRKYEEAAGKRPVEAEKPATAEQSAEWTQFKEDYPDIAKAIESKMPATAGVRHDDEVVQYVQQQKRERFLNDAWDAVEAVHPNWRDNLDKPEFTEWRASSPTYEKLASSDDVADAIALFDLFSAHTARSNPGAAAAPVTDPAVAAASSALAARRGAQVAGAKVASQKPQSPNPNIDLNDADQLFDFYASKADKRIKGRY